MKKLFISVGLIASLFAFDKVLPQNKTINILKQSPIYPKLAPLIKKGEIKAKATKKGDFYLIELATPRGKGLIYISIDGKYTIIGQVIDNKTKKPLIPNFPKNVEIIKKGVMFTFGKGKKEIYLVTDPECPFCRKMEKEKGKILQKKYKIHVILFPLPFHRNAKAMTYYILAGKTDEERAKRLKEILNGSDAWKKFKPTKAQKEKFNKELEASFKAVRELDAKGTPSIFDKNFNQIDWTQLGE